MFRVPSATFDLYSINATPTDNRSLSVVPVSSSWNESERRIAAAERRGRAGVVVSRPDVDVVDGGGAPLAAAGRRRRRRRHVEQRRRGRLNSASINYSTTRGQYVVADQREAGIPRRRHRHRLPRENPSEEIAYVRCKIVAVLGESVSVWVSVSASWNARLTS